MSLDVETIVLDSDEDTEEIELINNEIIDADNMSNQPNQEVESTRESTRSPLLECRMQEESVEPPAKIPKLDTNTSICDDEAQTCPICLDSWTNIGSHRVCTLKCGHLFGASCVIKWFKTQIPTCCPTCKVNTNPRDIRYVYARKLVAIDATELEKVKEELKAIKIEKTKLQFDLNKSICQERLLKEQVDKMKNEVMRLSAIRDMEKVTNKPASVEFNVHLYVEKALEISNDGKCRVMDSNRDLVIASMKTHNSLFGSMPYGIRLINVSSFKPTSFIHLHSEEIRDLKFHQQEPWALSVSLDQTIKVTDLNSNNIVCSYKGSSPLWSCCWNENNLNYFYAGERQGAVMKFDLRKMTEPLSVLSVPDNMSPVVSVASVTSSVGDALALGGLLVCKLDSLWMYEDASNECKRHVLPLEGPFISMSFNNVSRQLLVSTRPTVKHQRARHTVSYIEAGENDSLAFNTIHSFQGSSSQTQLSRSCFVNHRLNYVAAYVESSKSLTLWNINTGQTGNFIPALEPILDLNVYNSCNKNFLLRLTAKKLEFLKFIN